MNRLVRTIAFYAFEPLDSAHTSCMALFLVVFTLWHTGVHVCTTNCSDKTTYVKPSVNEALGFCSALYIPYVDPDDGYV